MLFSTVAVTYLLQRHRRLPFLPGPLLHSSFAAILMMASVWSLRQYLFDLRFSRDEPWRGVFYLMEFFLLPMYKVCEIYPLRMALESLLLLLSRPSRVQLCATP